MENCVFCKIVGREVAAEIEYESGDVIAFQDKNPAAQIHILIVPKAHIGRFIDIKEEDKEVLGEMVTVAQKLIEDKHIEEKYRISFNGGSLQIVPHLHMHLLGGDWIKNRQDF